MNKYSLHLTRYTSMLVSLGLLLGLVVTGCSDHDRNDGQSAKMTEINYIFSVITGTGKTNLSAKNVVLTAFDAAGNPLSVEQPKDKISAHTNITEEGVIGVAYYEGHAHVDNSATKLVLTYYDAAGKQVGQPDVIDNITISDGFIFEFTDEAPEPEPTTDIVWTPAKTDQSIRVGEDITVTALDAQKNELAVELDSDSDAITIDGAKLTAVSVTEEGIPAVVTATAKDQNGNVLVTLDYKITVLHKVTWNTPTSDLVFFENWSHSVQATDESGQALNVELISQSSDITVDDNSIFTPLQIPVEGITAKVLATAKDSEGNVYDTNTFNISAYQADPTIVFNSNSDFYNPLHLRVGESTEVTAQDAAGNALTVVITEQNPCSHITFKGNKITATVAHEMDYLRDIPFIIACDSNGKPVAFYFCTVYVDAE